MDRLENTKVSGISTRIAPNRMRNARNARMHTSLLKIGLAAVLVLLLVCSGAAAGADLIKYGDTVLTDNNSESENYILGTNSPFKDMATYESGKLTLNSNAVVNLEHSLEILGGVTDGVPDFTIDLNGGVIQRDLNVSEETKFSLIKINGGKGLNLTDNSTDTYTFFKVTGGIDSTSAENPYKWEFIDAPAIDTDVLTVEDLPDVTDYKTSKITSFEQLTSSEIGEGKIVMLKGGAITGGSGFDIWGDGGQLCGGGVFVDFGSNFTMKGGNIVGNTASVNGMGGGVFVHSNSNFTLFGGSIAGNYANDNMGGGVYLWGSFTVEGGSIVGNKATQEGGGVCIGTSTIMFTMKGGNITGNSADKGGGVDVYEGTFTMESGSIAGNTASVGGGVYLKSSGEFKMSENAKITRNKVGSADADNVYGGGVYIDGGTFTMEGGIIGGDTAADGNIAVCKNPGIDNKSEGGTSSGGGVYVASGTFTMSAGKISNNKAIMSNVNPDNVAGTSGNSECNGGGVYVTGKGRFTMSGSAIISNNIVESNASGGGVAVEHGEKKDNSDSAPVFTMDGGKITGNKVRVIFSSPNYSVKVHGGGGVKLNQGYNTFTMSGNAEISGNSVTADGLNPAVVTQGGGVYAYGQSSDLIEFTMTSGEIKGNSAEHGGGVYIGQKSTLKVSGTPKISGNMNKAGTANNVYLDDYFTPIPLITVSGELNDASIGIRNPLIGQFGTLTTTPGTGATTTFKMDDGSPITAVVADDGKGLRWDIPAAECGGVIYKTVGAAVAAVNNGQTADIKMINDSVEETITISNNTKITLDLAGHMLRNADGGSVIKVESGGDLTVRDNGGSTITHYFQVSDYDEDGNSIPVIPWGYQSGTPSDAEGNTISLKDIKSYNGADGGWAYSESNPISRYTIHKYKYVTVTGGVITGGGSNGGVYVNGGNFTMESGKIVGNSGSGVNVNSGSFTMSGTTSIVGNSGGGVTNTGGNFTMSGTASIVGNKVNGVKVENSGEFNVKGNPVIKGNGATPSNVDLAGNKLITVIDAFSGEIHVTNPAGTSQNPFGITSGSTADKIATGFISDPTTDGTLYHGMWESTNLKWNSSNAEYQIASSSLIMYGRVTATPSIAVNGTEITLTITPVAGYQFKEDTLNAYKTGDTQKTPVTITDKKFIMPNHGVTVEARFEPVSYTVTLYANDAAVNSFSQKYGESMSTLSGALPTKTGYNFAGYFDATTGGRMYYKADGTSAGKWDKTQNTPLYAQWTPNKYTITFDTQGGTQVDPITQDCGTTVTAPNNPSKDGYTFAGWNPAVPSTMPAYDMTCTAQWTANSQPSSSSSRNYGSSVWLPATAEPTPTPESPTVEPTQAQPTTSPVNPQPTSSSPMPIAGILAGLGAACVFFGLRRK